MKKIIQILILCILAFGTAAALRAETADIVKFGSEAVVPEGTTVQDAVAIGGGVTVNGIVEGDAVAIGGDVKIGPKGVVNHDTVSIGGSVIKADGAVVEKKPFELGFPKFPALHGWFPFGMILGFLAMIKIIALEGTSVLAFFIAGFFPAQIGAVSFTVEKDARRAVLIGLLAAFLAIPVGAVLLISIIGIPLIPVEILLIAAALLVGYVAMAQLIGKKAFQAIKKPGRHILWETFCGLLILWFVGWVPIAGHLIRLIVVLIGFGACLDAAYKAVRR